MNDIVSTAREKAILVHLSVGLPTGAKTDRSQSAKVTAQNGAKGGTAKVVKLLYPEGAIDPIQSYVGECKRWNDQNTLPWSNDARRILPALNFWNYKQKERDLRATFETLRDEFLVKLPEHIAQAEKDLVGLFNPEDYKADVASKFYWTLSFEPIPNGADFRLDMQAEDLKEMQDSIDRRVASTWQAAQTELYKRLAEPLGKMATSLTDPDKTFRDTLVGNLQEALDIIPKLSLERDPVLQALLDRAKALTAHTPQTLRDDKRIRADVARRADEMMKAMEGVFGTGGGLKHAA